MKELIWELLDWLKEKLGMRNAVDASGKLFIPLFFNGASGLCSTWPYLAMGDADRQAFRDYVKREAKSGETPAICFLLTPHKEGGYILSDDMIVNPMRVKAATEKIKELVREGIAVFCCLYTDDDNPRWWLISDHVPAWKAVHKAFGRYVSGYCLSIETNEYAKSVGQLEGCIDVMRAAMPDAQHYTTHLQWKSDNGKFCWRGESSRPQNITCLLVENSWQPQRGDTVNVGGLEREFNEIERADGRIKKIWHEFNINPAQIMQKQRDLLRSKNPFGVG